MKVIDSQQQVAGVTDDGGNDEKGGFMAIWELIPTDEESESWRGYEYYKRRLVIRASGEDEARELVGALCTASRSTPGGSSPHNPWMMRHLAVCKPYDANGPDEILEPKKPAEI